LGAVCRHVSLLVLVELRANLTVTVMLCRFVPSLRGDGIDVVIGVFKALCILGGEYTLLTTCRNHAALWLVS
jgi:hypothetical protein